MMCDGWRKTKLSQAMAGFSFVIRLNFFINDIPWVSSEPLPYTSFGTMTKWATIYLQVMTDGHGLANTSLGFERFR